MNRLGVILFILGIFISLVAGTGVFVLLTFSQPKPPEAPTTKVVIAFQEISTRTEILADQVGESNWPAAVPTPTGATDSKTDVVGKFSTVPIYPGEPVLQKMVIDKSQVKETHSNAALLLEKGSVAMAVPVNIKSDVAQAIQAGDRVDVIGTFKSPSATGAGQIATQRMLADILVIQVGIWPSPNQKPPSSGGDVATLTLQLKEQDVLVLEYSLQNATDLTLVLRPANDHDLPQLEPATFDYVNQRFGFKLAR